MADLRTAPVNLTLQGNTASRMVKTNPKDTISVEIGDSKQPDFKPQFKVTRWDNEVNLSVRSEEVAGATTEVEGDVVKYITPDWELHQYEKPDVSEDGGFEFEWVLKSKPASNVLNATIQTKGLDFFYQPALTQKEIDEGANRPENVVGSYAVYHSTKGGLNRADGMEYKVGKFCHIYRPEAEDANGKKTWCDLNIDTNTGLLTVTVPQKFLDEAVYPVKVDPTFGYDTIGGSTTNSGTITDQAAFTNGTPSAGDITQIDLYAVRGSTNNVPVKAGIWLQSDNSLLGGSFTSEGSVTDSAQWYTLTYVSPPSISAIGYRVGYFMDVAASRSLEIYYDTGGANSGGTDGVNYSSTTDLDGSFSNTTFLISVYATYTSGGGGGGGNAGIVFTSTNSSTADSASYTYGGQSIGDASSDRWIVVTTGARKAGAGFTLSTVTVGGVGASILAQVTNTATNSDAVGMAIAPVPSGTVASVVVGWSTTVLRNWIGVYSLTNLAAPLSPSTDTSTSSAPSVDINTTTGDCAIGAAETAATTSASWTGLEQEDFDTTVETFLTYSGAHQSVLGTNTPLTMTATFGSAVESAGVFGVWGGASVAGGSVLGRRLDLSLINVG